ncbi:uncharacterized protein LOC122457267 isoform X4 [Dermochelys coriacea]|uniref:uncharacterized protein LOC122457267 isoform X4 n=1 Tax=Dermochelys coriacea TaxID=27794 RepID=UPI001CA94136|nr:uncharacterized protein LOC122457267 isoform X4 [Dermochelys coriacea]
MLLRDIQAESPALDHPMILLWLLCDFPSPKLSLSTSSAQVGDSVSAQCHLRLNSLAALVIFCQDGKEISRQKAMPGRSLYRHDISVWSSSQFRCMYQYKNDQNQVKNSRLSLPRTLNVPGGRLGLEAILGITGLSVLCLAPLIYLLVKKVASKRRCPREQLPNRSTENMPTDEQIHYAAIGQFGATRLPRVQENETATYAAVGKVRDRPS